MSAQQKISIHHSICSSLKQINSASHAIHWFIVLVYCEQLLKNMEQYDFRLSVPSEQCSGERTEPYLENNRSTSAEEIVRARYALANAASFVSQP